MIRCFEKADDLDVLLVIVVVLLWPSLEDEEFADVEDTSVVSTTSCI